MEPQVPKRKAVLICIDGWGISSDPHGNAILNAETPVMDAFAASADNPVARQWASLDASGEAVGLPDGVMGNSEVGHLTIGAGRPEFQALVRINRSMRDGTFAENSVLRDAFTRAKSGNGRLHFLGLLSDGGVHAHIDHLFRFLLAAKEAGVPTVFIQAFGDGRDTPPKSLKGYTQQLLEKVKDLGYGQLATIIGRYYAMDRDRRWDRIEIALSGLIHDREKVEEDAVAAVQARYDNGETDEFIKPIVINKEGGIQKGDTLVFTNYRADRMREINECFGVDLPPECEKVTIPSDISVVTMTEYKSSFPMPKLYPPQTMDNVLAEWLGKLQVKQLHTAETEKYAHVTFFFNGGTEQAYPLEERTLVASPKVATYDKDPEMSQAGVADVMINAIESGEYPLAICNFAAPDMVGHTGMYEEVRVAVASCDKQIGRIWEACKKHSVIMFVTSDHGNAELMKTANGDPVTKHSTNFVPLVCADPDKEVYLSKGVGTLTEVAPTVLTAMGLTVPEEMTGQSMI